MHAINAHVQTYMVVNPTRAWNNILMLLAEGTINRETVKNYMPLASSYIAVAFIACVDSSNISI